MTKIKLCGLSRTCDIEEVNEQKPEYIGFVFAKKSKRYVSPKQAKELKEMLHPSILAVGVFVNEEIEEVEKLFLDGIIDIVQLHGNESDEYIKKLKKNVDVPVIQAFQIETREDLNRAKESIADYVLLDSGAGTGTVFDWSLLEGFNRPYFLAGGLHPKNVEKAIKTLHPYAVDVSSGIEIDGNTFPKESYVFPDEEEYTKADANKSATSGKYGIPAYDPTKLTLDGVENTGIKAVADPTEFIKKNSQTAQEYLNAFVDAGIKSHHLSYLRDTNKPITGRIYYQLAEGGSVKSQGFTIPSSEKAIRNRELVVYGYFLQGGALCLDWQVMPWNVVTSEISWSNVNCQMFAWQTPSTNETEFTPNPQGGDAGGLYCLVNYPRYQDKDHKILEDAPSGAAFYIKVDGPTGLVWKAHLTNPTEFAFNYGKSTESTNCVSTGIARKDPYQIKVEAVKSWTELTEWAKGKDSNPVYTDLYVTVSLDGIHEYEVEINPDKAGGRYKNERKFAGTNTRIRIFQLQAIKDKGYDDLQKESEQYTNYLE